MRAVGEAAADDDDGRHADELGVLELDAGAGLATVVEQHLDTAGLERPGELLGVRGHRLVLAGGDDVDVGRGERPRPDDAEVVVVALDDARDGPRDADAVRPHGHRAQRPVLVEHLEVERLGVLRAELEDVPHLDAARRLQRVAARGAGVAVADLGGLDRAVGGEVTTRDEVDDVTPRLVGAGDPRGALADPRVEHVADAGRPPGTEHARADVPLGEHGVRRELLVVERLDGRRLDLGAQPLLVDLTVTGQSDRQRLARAVGVHEHDEHVLQRVGRGPRPPVGSRERAVEVRDERVDRRGVGGVLDVRGGHAGRVDGIRYRHAHRLDVGGVAAVRAAHVGVLAVLGGREELLRLRAAHRAGHRLDDDVVEPEPVEDPDVRVAVQLVALVEPGLVEVEGVRVLHDELAPAQHAGARPRLVAVLRLDLVERQRQVLVRAVHVLDREGEHLLVGRPEQVVVALAVDEPEDVDAVLAPATGRLVGLTRQQRGEEQLLRPDGVHLLADDRLDPAQHLEAERQPGVDARADPPDVAGPHEQLVARDLGVRRVLAKGSQEQGRHAHGHGRAPGVGWATRSG